MGVQPVVRFFVLCEDVVHGSHEPQRASLISLVTWAVASPDPAIATRLDLPCAFALLTECRGTAVLQTRVAHAESGAVVFDGVPRRVSFGSDPLEPFGIPFRLRGVVFPDAGVYEVQLWYNGSPIAHQPLLLRPQS